MIQQLSVMSNPYTCSYTEDGLSVKYCIIFCPLNVDYDGEKNGLKKCKHAFHTNIQSRDMYVSGGSLILFQTESS